MVTSTAVRLGELTIEQHDRGFTLRGPEGRGEAVSVVCEPTELSDRIRTDDLGRYRPLSGARTMRCGWETDCANRKQLDSALDAIYPLARTHKAQWRAGTLRVVSLDELLKRQSGRYAAATSLSDAGRKLATLALCGDCVRTPVWNQEIPPKDGIPCPEACSVLVALCREAAIWESDRPTPSDINDGIGYAEFYRPGNGTRETILHNTDLQQRS